MIPAIQELNFPKIDGKQYATLTHATVNLADMGEKTISTQVKIDGDIVPDFSQDWEVEFQGEKYIMPLRQPQGAKENTSLNSTIDLTFQHWAVYQLKRWTFVTMQPIDTGTAVADEEVASVQLNLKDFCDLFGQVLRHYYGDTITIDLNPAWQYDNAPTAIEINHSYIWNVLIDAFHDKYGVRWAIEPREDNDNTVKGGERYVIKIGYPTTEVDHIFEYGFEGGLLKLERQVQSEDIHNMIKGRGGDTNIPFRYFKDTDPNNKDFAPDPDWVEELKNIPFKNLMPATYRSYIQGWKAAHISKYPGYKAVGENNAYSPWAYRKGFTDTKFHPVEFVADEITLNPQAGDRQVQIYPDYSPYVKKGSSIDVYGPLLAPLDNNDDIYPTIQGTGLDIAVDVEQIESDDVVESVENDAQIKDYDGASTTIDRFFYNGDPTSFQIVVQGSDINIPTGTTGDLEIINTDVKAFKSSRFFNRDKILPVDVADYELESYKPEVVTTSGEVISPIDIPSGSYTFRVIFNIRYKVSPPKLDYNFKFTASFGGAKLVTSTIGEQWTNTFNVWVKDIWSSKKLSGETDSQYSERVWKPILGDRDKNTAKVVFTSGMLLHEDYEFTIVDFPVPDTSKTYTDANGVRHDSYWRIKLAKSDAELEATGLYVPSTQKQGKAGDRFVFIGTEMTHVPYVVDAEIRLDDWKKDHLGEVKEIKPTFVVTTDRVRLNDEGKPDALINQLRVGNTLRIADKRFIQPMGDRAYETLYLQSLTYTYREPSSDDAALNPDVEIVLSNEYTTSANPISVMQGEISSMQRLLGSISNVEQIVRAVGDKLYLRKDGISDRSLSPTQFFSLLTSGGFRAGIVGGAGWGFFKDENNNWVLEADRVNVRQEMQVNTLVINQAEGRGGMEIDTAAFMEVTQVVETSDGYICYFDQKEGSVANLFHIDDVAYCNRWTPENQELKFYKRRVIAVGVDNITLSKTDVNGSGIPAEKDNIIHFGNYTDKRRQYVKVRDVVGGGYERYIEELNSVNAAGVEYYFVGKQSGQSRWFVGNKDLVPYSGKGDGSYIEYINRRFNLNNVTLSVNTTIGDKTIDEYIKLVSPPVEQEDIEGFVNAIVDPKLEGIQDQIDGVIESFFGFGAPTLNNYPANEWTTDEARKAHERDTYTDKTEYVDDATTPTAGQSWKWQYTSPTDYGWVKIADSDAVKALLDAAKAQDTADGKRRVFTAQPATADIYDAGDLWVNATYGTQYRNDILRCLTHKGAGAAFNIAHWTLASKYTDDTALNTFVQRYETEIKGYKEQLDGKIDTWYFAYDPTASNKPASDWNATEKSEHAGDLFFNTVTKKIFRWTGTAWESLTDPDIQAALEAAADAQDTADKKRRVFMSQPTTPYDTGDLWIDGGTNGKTLKVCTSARATGAFASGDWAVADDASLNVFATTIENSLNGIRDQIDQKAETWYQPTDPSTAWKTADDKALHKGDLWYCTADIAGTNYRKNTTWYWNGTAWEQQDIPQSVFDTIDGKADIFVSKPTDGYHKNDLWFLEAAYTLSGVAYKEGTLVVAVRDMGAAWSANDWVKKDRYTDDTLAQQAKDAAAVAKAAADTAKASVADLNKYVDGAFKDGIITAAEASGIANYINTVNADKEQIKATYNALLSNAYLSLLARKPLVSAYETVIGAIDSLLSAINNAIADNSITPDEVTAVNNAFATFGVANADFCTAVENANKAIQDTLKNAADAAKTAADNAQQAADDAKEEAAAAKNRLDEWADDGVISPTEKQGIKDEIARIDSDFDHINNGYKRYSLGLPIGYNKAHGTYNSQLAVLSADTPETIAIPADFTTKQTAYYDERAKALNEIAAKAKEYAEETARQEALKAVAGYEYLKEAIANGATQFEGGLMLSSHIRLGEWDKSNPDNPVMSKVWAGMNGIYSNTALGRTIASWWGGDMVDRFNASDVEIKPVPANAAAALVRMNGSAYFAAGNIGFRADGSGWLGSQNAITWTPLGVLTIGAGVTFNVSNVSGLKDTLDSFSNFVTAITTLLAPADANGEELGWNEIAKAQTIMAKKTLFSLGNISAHGIGSSSGGGSVFGLYTDSTWSATPSSTDALGAALGKSLNTRLEAVEGKNYLDELVMEQSGSGNAVTSIIQSADKKTLTVVKATNFLSSVTKAMVENVLTGDITSHTHSQYALSSSLSSYYTKTEADGRFMRAGDYYTKSEVYSSPIVVYIQRFIELDFDDDLPMESMASKTPHVYYDTISKTLVAAAGILIRPVVTSPSSVYPNWIGAPGMGSVLSSQSPRRGWVPRSDVLYYCEGFYRWNGTDMEAVDALNDTGGLDESHLASYLTTNNYAKKSDIPSLSGYATEGWVQSQGFLKSHQPINTLVILKNGTAVGSYKPNEEGKIIDITDVASAATLSGHMGDATVHVTTAERTRWNKMAVDFDAITGTDADNIINKWEEVVAFLSTYTEADTLAGLLRNKANKATTLAGYGITDAYTKTEADGRFQPKGSYLTAITKAQVEAVLTGNITSHTHVQYAPLTLLANYVERVKLANDTDIAALTGNHLYYSDTDGNSATFKNSPFVQSFMMLTQTCYNSGNDVRRARLAVEASGGIKVFNDRSAAGTAGTWHTVLTDLNTKISGGTITINGTSITPLTSHQSLANYVTKNTAQDITGVKTFVGEQKFVAAGNSYTDPWLGTVCAIKVTGKVGVTDSIKAASFVKQGGTSAQFLMADGSVATKHILSSVTNLGWSGTSGHVATINTLAFWNGQYAGGASNLQYCDRGRFGTMATKNAADYPTMSSFNAGVAFTAGKFPDQGAVFNVMHDEGVLGIGINVNIPTKTSHLTNDSGFLTGSGADARYVTALGIAGDWLTWTKNGAVNNLTVYFAQESKVLRSHGRLTAVTNTKHGAGLRMYEVYNNGYPTLYGNLIAVQGGTSSGQGELLLGWSGSNSGHASIYYRNQRDNDSAFSAWATILDSVNFNSVIGSNLTAYIKKTGDTMTGALLMTAAATAPAASTTTALSYGRLQCYGTLNINGNTDNSGTEYVNITAGHGVSSSTADGLSIGTSTLTWQNNTVWHAGNDGSGSGLDADLLDGLQGTSYAYGGRIGFLVGSARANITTAQFISKLSALGAFNRPQWSVKCTWSYANNDIITDTGLGNIQLAGAVIEVHSNSANEYTVRITTSPTASGDSGGVTNAVFIYRNHGSGYAPNWKRLANTSDNVASATKLQTARTLWGQSFNGAGNVDGTLRIQANESNYCEGIRIKPTAEKWTTIVLGGSDLTANNGTSAKSWSIHNNDGDFYINKNGSSTQGAPRLWGHANGWTVGNTSRTTYALNTASFICDSWVRTVGNAGWYSETHGGGWHMNDSTWIRSHNNKSLYMGTGTIRTDNLYDRQGYGGNSWNKGYGAYNVSIANNAQQTPLMVAYRAGQSPSVEGANRLFALELLNAGSQLNFAFGGSEKVSMRSDGSVTAASFVKRGGTSEQALMANGGVRGMAKLRDGGIDNALAIVGTLSPLITEDVLVGWDGSTLRQSGSITEIYTRTSNLAYCNKGAFGDMATKSAADYVTVATAQNISGAKRFSSGILSVRNTNACGLVFYSFSDSDTDRVAAIELLGASGSWLRNSLDFYKSGRIVARNTLTATSFIKSGGTASQVLMADGSVRETLTSSVGTMSGLAIPASSPQNSIVEQWWLMNWDGRFMLTGDDTAYCNLRYCDRGRFGTMATKNASDYVSGTVFTSTLNNFLSKADAQNTYQPKGNYLTAHQSLANYVTLNTAQTISGNKTFTGLVTTKAIQPEASGSYNLGTMGLHWNHVFCRRLYVTSGGSDSLTAANLGAAVGLGWLELRSAGTPYIDLTGGNSTADYNVRLAYQNSQLEVLGSHLSVANTLRCKAYVAMIFDAIGSDTKANTYGVMVFKRGKYFNFVKTTKGSPDTIQPTNHGGSLMEFNLATNATSFAGVVTASNISTSSDARLKTRVDDIALTVADIAAAPLWRYKWKDTGAVDVGSTAQYWGAILPELTHTDQQGWMSLDYGKTALLASVSLARTADDHETRIKALETENALLRDEIARLKNIA